MRGIIEWALDWLRQWVGRKLLSPELEQMAEEEARRDAENARRRQEQDRIIDANVSSEEAARDLEEGKF